MNSIRQAIQEHWRASEVGEVTTEHAIYAEDAVLDYPQSGERFRGRTTIPIRTVPDGRTISTAPGAPVCRPHTGELRERTVGSLVVELAGRYGRSMAERVVEKLAASVPSWGARVTYGETTTVGGQDIVPVAIVVFGFGAGEGSGETPATEKLPQGKGEGAGGGGGGIALPIGAYVQGADGAVFKPNTIALVLAVAPIVMSAIAAMAAVSTVRSAVKGFRRQER